MGEQLAGRRLAEAATELTTGQAEPEAVLERRLRAFRRRNLWRSGLGLCFAAALCNEVYRWGSIIVGSWLGIAFPHVNVGPFFLATAFLLVRRRWTPEYTASRADAAGRFLDRFVSYREFSRRPHLAAAFREAQARETVRALAEAPPWGPHPARSLLLAGPILLAASVIYPMLAITPLTVISPQGPGGEDGFRTDAGSPGEGLPPSHVAKSVKSDQQTAQPNPDPRQPDREGPREEARRSPAPATPGQPPARHDDKPSNPAAASSEVALVPKTELVTAQEPKIVDPVFSPTEEAGAQPKPKIKGSIGYRLLPLNRGGGRGGAAGAGVTADEAGRRALVINYDLVPEEYRLLVRDYFDQLARAGAVPGGGERKGRD